MEERLLVEMGKVFHTNQNNENLHKKFDHVSISNKDTTKDKKNNTKF